MREVQFSFDERHGMAGEALGTLPTVPRLLDILFGTRI